MGVMNIIRTLRTKGWIPFVLPRGAKFPPPKGMTGAKAETGEALDTLIDEQEDQYNPSAHNVGIRMPEGVIGIDVDNSEDEIGGQIRDVTSNTYRISSTDGISRFTALYRVPDGFEYENMRNLPKVIDLITPSHRYTVMGLHPSGREYSIYGPAGEKLDSLPPVSSLELLPSSVMDLMKRETKKTETIKITHKGTSKTGEWVMSQPACSKSVMTFNRGIEMMNEAPSRHEGVLRLVWALNRENNKGHSVGPLVGLVIDEFISLVGDSDRLAEVERTAETLAWVDAPCSACESQPAGNYDLNLLKDAGLDEGELVSEMWIKSSELSFPTDGHRASFERVASKNLMLDKIQKDKNRRKAEELYMKQLSERSVSVSGNGMRELVDSIAKTDQERTIAYMLAFGFSRKEIGEAVGISNPTLKKRIMEMGRRV